MCGALESWWFFVAEVGVETVMAIDDTDKAERNQVRKFLHASRRPYLLSGKLRGACKKVISLFAEKFYSSMDNK